LPEAGLRGLQGLVTLNLEMKLNALPPHLPKSIPSLTYLGLNNNAFKAIPSSLSELQKLQTLAMIGNSSLQLSRGVWRCWGPCLL